MPHFAGRSRSCARNLGQIDVTDPLRLSKPKDTNLFYTRPKEGDMAKQRIYVVRSSDPDDVTLVRAPTQAQAIRHVVRDYTAEVASQAELVDLLGKGAVVEQAGTDSA